jgi:hypothetical protein
VASPATTITASAPLDAAQEAVEHTRRQLFPFRFERWVALGFVAFLDQCGRTGSLGNFPGGGPGGGGNGKGAGAEVDAALAWLGAHVLLVSVLAALALAFVVLLMAAVLWVNSRGVFMYVDDVATGRADVGRPWRAHAAHASSYFAWSFAVAMAMLIAVLLLVLGGALSVLWIVRARTPSAAVPGIAAIVLLVLLLLAVGLLVALVTLGQRDFVAPLQMRTGRTCTGAWRLLLALLRAHPGVFVVYVLLKICAAFAIGLAALIVGCGTCCCGFLPVVAQTALQPAYYFERAWPLFLLRRLGYDVFPSAPAPPPHVPPRADPLPVAPPPV